MITPLPCLIIAGQQRAIQAHRGEKVLVERLLPLLVVEHREAACRRR